MKKVIIPKSKLSKKARKELNIKDRRTWNINPVTRVVPNKKKELQKRSARRRVLSYE